MKLNPDQGYIAKLRSAGFFTKGIVYFLIGTLTFMAAFNLGGDVTSTDGVIQFLLSLPLGVLLVGIVALGLFAYTLWRLYETLFLPGTNSGSEKIIKKGFKRFRYLYSSIFYGILAYSFAHPLIEDLTSGKSIETDSGGDVQSKAALWELLSKDWGSAVIWILALVIAVQSFWQFKLAYSAKFMKKIDNYPDIKHEYDVIQKSGRLGYSARGVVFGIISFFLVKVVLQHNANNYKGTEGALQYLLSFSYGSFLLGATAAGLVGYGIFNLMVARHADLTTIQ